MSEKEIEKITGVVANGLIVTFLIPYFVMLILGALSLGFAPGYWFVVLALLGTRIVVNQVSGAWHGGKLNKERILKNADV